MPVQVRTLPEEIAIVDTLAAELSQQIRVRWNSGQLRFDDESIPCAEADENAEGRELNKQEPTITRREKRANRTDQQPAVGNAAHDKAAHATQAERGKAPEYRKSAFV